MATKTLKDYPIIELNIDDIKKDPTNPNTMTLEQSRGLEKSMLNFGRLKHIVVDQNNVLVDGEHRLEVEKAIGTQKVNVIQVNVKDEIERKIIRETLNKLHGQYDKQKESNELLAIFENQRLDELAELLAKPKQELENLISRYNPNVQFAKEEDDAKLPSLFNEPSFVKKGEIWQLGRHYLMCGDCINKENIDKLLDNNKIDLIITDPPYGVEYKPPTNQNNNNNNEILNDNKQDFDTFIDKTISIFPEIIKNNSVLYIFHSHTQQLPILQSLEKYNIIVKALLIWIKNSSTWSGYLNRIGVIHYKQQHEPIYYCYLKDSKQSELNWYGGMEQSTILEFDKPQKNIDHPTTKPIELLNKFIKNSSNTGNLVFDPFLGSGSTLIACEQTNRICYGMEIDEHYCSVIIKRWENYTGQKAQKIS